MVARPSGFKSTLLNVPALANGVLMAEEKQDKQEKQRPQKQEISIVRLAGRDINGSFKLEKALMRVKGIGSNMAHALSLSIEKKLSITPETQIGSLTEEQLTSIEDIMKSPKDMNIPSFMFNRRKDMETGSDIHVFGTDVTIKVRQDIENDIKMQSWRGFRHQYGQKVRGQRTRSTGRTGATIGVTKKKGLEGAAAAAKATEAQQQKAGPAPTAPAKPAPAKK